MTENLPYEKYENLSIKYSFPGRAAKELLGRQQLQQKTAFLFGNEFFEMAAMPFPCNGHLLCYVKFC